VIDEVNMNNVKISPKYQVVIPKRVREEMEIKPGEEVQVLSFDDRIELILVRKIQEMRGYLEGMDTAIERNGDRL
jgi:AbrB family looped-hinge helix DNA binding protein